jgi:arylsulfatase A-like enzyme
VAYGADPQPNVVFIFADDQRADTIAALGNSVIKTPNLDRLVARGVSFNRAYMQGGNNAATCVPSRAMLMSGRSLAHIDEKLLQHETWPQAFGAAGYNTFMSGKWHNGAASAARSFQTARQLFLGGMTNPMAASLQDILPNGKPGPVVISKKHGCEVFTDETVHFIQEAGAKAQPYLVYLAFDGPHDPHIVPDDYPVKYNPDSIPLPPNFLPQHPFNNGEMVVRDELLLPWPRTSHDVQQMLADYYRYISFLDLQIGRVLDAVESTGKANRTIIIFSADSGVARGSHGLIGKQNLYEHSLRVPLVFAGPGIAVNQRTDAMCYLYDVFPTLGQLCHVPAPATSEGREFSAVLQQPQQGLRPNLMFAYKKVQKGYTDGRWKLIRYPQVNRTQLFDLQTDPYETHDLSSDPAQVERIKSLTEAMAHAMVADGDHDPLTANKLLPAEWQPPAKSKKVNDPGN